MAISLYDTEEVIPVQTVQEIKREKEKQKAEPVSKVRSAKAPPTMGEAFQTFMGDMGVKPAYDTVSNAPGVVKDYLMNPIQYKDGGEQDYTNIDFGATAPRLAADAALAYGGAKGLQYGVGQVFPTAGVKQQKDELAFRREELKRQMEGNLTPQEKAHIALQDAKTQQILASLNPQAITPPASQVASAPPAPPVAQVAPPTQTVPTQPIAPSIQQRNITPAPIAGSTGELPPEVLSSPGYKAFTSLEEKTGGPITTATDLKMIQQSEANRIAKEQEAIAKAQQAVDAGVTPTTSAPEAQTLVASHEAALTPAEKTISGAAKPKKSKIPEGMTKEEFGMKNHLLGTYGGAKEPLAHEAYDTVKNILGYTPAYAPGEGGGLAPKETEKILGYRKENIHGPKVNLTHEMKKIIKGGGVASLLALPAFINAKTFEEKKAILQDAAEGLLPIGMTPTEAGAPVLPPGAYSESKKLGSPFHVFPNQGRGIMPPSAYR
jgi:hypothetical protein